MQRILVLSGIFGVLTFGILFCKLWQLQVVQHEKLENKAITQQTREISSTANRGTIYDANGDILAISGSVQNVILSPRDVLATVKVDEKDEFGNARSKTAIEAEKETKVQATYDLIADEMSEILGLDRGGCHGPAEEDQVGLRGAGGKGGGRRGRPDPRLY